MLNRPIAATGENDSPYVPQYEVPNIMEANIEFTINKELAKLATTNYKERGEKHMDEEFQKIIEELKQENEKLRAALRDEKEYNEKLLLHLRSIRELTNYFR